MDNQRLKTLSIAAWVLTILVVGLTTNISSPGGWTMLSVIAILPSFVVMHFWRAPAQTMSEAIHKALR